MDSTTETFTGKFVERIKYLEGLLERNNIVYEPAQPDLQKLIDNVVNLQRTLEGTQLKRVLAERYSRQMFISEISTEGQEKLRNAKVLIVGAGGIGAPAAMYLAGAGVGKIGIIDKDIVEESNLHRQIIHSNAKLGVNKARSARSAVLEFNPHVKVEIYEEWLSQENAQSVVQDYDIVLDASDNAIARYLVNDICILNKKTLVSGCAIRWEGQLTIFGKDDGPCYRCLYPDCPHPSMMQSCGDGGVVGMVPGLIGILEALEAVKLIVGVEDILHKKLLIFDGKSCGFRRVKIRGRNPACISCGDQPSIKDVRDYDYDTFTGMGKCASKLYVDLPPQNNIKWKEFLEVYKSENFDATNLLVDIRPEEQFKITNLGHELHLPYAGFMLMQEDDMIKNNVTRDKNIYILCRRGNTSRNATKHLLEMGYENVINIVGGMNEYSRDFDPSVPLL